jgi:dUTP pyrophosphatase
MKVRLSSEYAILPTRANPGDAGLDLYVPLLSDKGIKPGQREAINTHVQVSIPEGHVGFLMARSSLQKKSLMLANSVGVIDAGYRGDLIVVLYNFGTNDACLVAGERFAQLVIVPISTPAISLYSGELDDWNDTDRGAGGFGSTGTA